VQAAQLVINDQALPASEVVRQVENGKQVIGTLVEVPIQSTTTLELTYRRSLESQPGSLSYVFFDQKQPGTETEPTTITINHPSSLNPTLIAPQATVQAGKITYNVDRQQHIFVGTQF
jgi:hypothetical protein